MRRVVGGPLYDICPRTESDSDYGNQRRTKPVRQTVYVNHLLWYVYEIKRALQGFEQYP